MTKPSRIKSLTHQDERKGKRTTLRKAQVVFALVGLAWCSSSGVSKAGLLVKEAFDYPIDEVLTGQGGGTGFGDAWQHRYTSAADAKIVAGLTFSDYPVSGNAVHFHAETETKSVTALRRLDANFESAPQPVWMSYLFTYIVEPGNSPTYYSGVNTTNNQYPDNYRFGVAGLNGSGRFGVSYESPTVAGGSKESAPSTTYLLIGKYVGGVSATMWALTEKDYDAIKSGGITEEKLNATNSGTASSNFVAEQADSLQEFLGIGAATFGAGSTLNVTMDELKLGTSLSDVTAGPTAAPR